MVNGKLIGIDARMIEMSGIGTYIQHLMGRGIYDYAVGDETQIRKYDKDVQVIHFDAPIYGLKEQLFYPNHAIENAGISLMHFPHYSVPVTYRGDYVVTVHDLTHIVFPEFLGRKIKYYYAKLLMGNAVHRARHIFTVSQNSRVDIQSYFGVEAEKITVTYNAVDSDFRNKSREDTDYVFDKFGISRDKKIILYVGNLKPHKNLDALLKAIKMMNDPDIVLLLVGKAFKSTDLLEKEREMGLSDFVIHTGVVDKEELVDLYNIGDVFAFPSLYEGFGLPPLEAMACGTPVVAANNSSIPEVLGEAALLVDCTNVAELAKGIRTVLEDDAVAKELIKRGFARANSYSWLSTVEKTKQVLEEQLFGKNR